MAWEFDFIIFLQSFGNTFLDLVFEFFSLFGEELVMIPVIAFVYFCYNKRMAHFLGYSVLTSVTANTLLKNIFVRDRPFQSTEHDIINKRPSTAGGFSFPSGHSQGSASLFVSIAIWCKKRWITVLAIVIPFLCAFSRLYLGVHFPTDVIAGLAFGVGISFLCYFLFNKVENKKLLYLITGILLATGLFFAKTEDYFVTFGMFVGTMSGFLFEERFVNFDFDVCWWKKLIRLVLGVGLILGLRLGLKELFHLFANEGTMLMYYFDMIRYGMMTFVGIGLYPMLFKKLNF